MSPLLPAQLAPRPAGHHRHRDGNGSSKHLTSSSLTHRSLRLSGLRSATSTGRMPRASLLEWSAPCSISRRTTLALPQQHAHQSAVRPLLSATASTSPS